MPQPLKKPSLLNRLLPGLSLLCVLACALLLGACNYKTEKEREASKRIKETDAIYLAAKEEWKRKNPGKMYPVQMHGYGMRKIGVMPGDISMISMRLHSPYNELGAQDWILFKDGRRLDLEGLVQLSSGAPYTMTETYSETPNAPALIMDTTLWDGDNDRGALLWSNGDMLAHSLVVDGFMQEHYEKFYLDKYTGYTPRNHHHNTNSKRYNGYPNEVFANAKASDAPHIMRNVQKIATGWGARFTLALTKEGKLYAIGNGSNAYGQLGDNGTDENGIKGYVLDKVIDMDAGVYHGLALRADGSVWMWGQDDWDGMKGYGGKPLHQVQGIPPNIVKISAGPNTSYALTADGKIWAWGDPTCNALGKPELEIKKEEWIKTPRVDENGECLRTAGWWCDKYAQAQKRNEPVGSPKDDPDPEGFTIPPRLIEGINKRITDIAAGPYYAIALDAEKRVWGWGETHMHGQIGWEETYHKPKKSHWGACRDGYARGLQLQDVPRRMLEVRNIKRIFAGSHMTGVLTEGNEFWTIGNGCQTCGGQLHKHWRRWIEAKWQGLSAAAMYCDDTEGARLLYNTMKNWKYESDSKTGRSYILNLTSFHAQVSSIFGGGFDVESGAMMKKARKARSAMRDAKAKQPKSKESIWMRLGLVEEDESYKYFKDSAKWYYLFEIDTFASDMENMFDPDIPMDILQPYREKHCARHRKNIRDFAEHAPLYLNRQMSSLRPIYDSDSFGPK